MSKIKKIKSMDKKKIKLQFETAIKFYNNYNTTIGYVIYENGTVLVSPVESSDAFYDDNNITIGLLSTLINSRRTSVINTVYYEYTPEIIDDVMIIHNNTCNVLTHDMTIVNNTNRDEMTNKIISKINNDMKIPKPIFYFFRDANNKKYRMYDIELNKYVSTSLNIKLVTTDGNVFMENGRIFRKHNYDWINDQSSCSIM